MIDDGIAADEYPPLAPARGEGFPEAYEMEDWIWDRAGEGWSVAIVTDSTGWEGDGRELQPAEVYLVSTEGVYFDLFSLAPEFSDGAMVATWRESDHIATVLWGESAGGELNLDTGAVDPLEFGVGEVTTEYVHLLASNRDGTELWMAWDGTYTHFFRWTPGTGYEEVRAGQTDIFAYDYPASPNSELLLLPIWEGLSERSGQPGRPNFVVYSLATGEAPLVVPAWPTDATYCHLERWRGSGSIGATCGFPEGAPADYLELVVDGVTGAVGEPPANLQGSVEYAQDAIYDSSEVTLASGVVLVSEPDSDSVFEVRVPTTDGLVTVADSTNYLLRSGGYLVDAAEVAPGVLRLSLGMAVLTIDLETGETVALTRARTAAGIPTLRTTLAFHGEAAGQWITTYRCDC